MIKWDKCLIDDLVNRVMMGIDINDEEEVIRKINEVIDESRMGEKDLKEENRLINYGFE